MNDLKNFLTSPVGVLVIVLVLAALVAVAWFVSQNAKKKPVSKPEPEVISQEPPVDDRILEETPPEVVVEEETVVEEPALEVPERAATRMERLRARLASSGAIGQALLAVFARGELSETDWEEIEETLLMADVGMDGVDEVMGRLRTEAQVRGGLDAEEAREVLREELLKLLEVDASRELILERTEAVDGALGPASVLVVGVNGTGKTTTVGKMARLLTAEDQKVVLGAADTFRAAATEQLTTWGDRVGVPVVASKKEGGDPASVAFDAVAAGREAGSDVVIVDTAGRLQTKATLMDELGKIRRVMEKHGPVGEVLLVLDATTGQNGMRQAQVFGEAVGLTGIVLTKLDGSAKGGIVFAVQKELGVPVKLVGLGEGPDDLAPFDPDSFVDAIVGA